MPYSSVSELPEQFGNLPDNARRMAMHVINSILKSGGSEESAFKQAWSTIKKSYHKNGNMWVSNNGSFTESVGNFCVEVYNSDTDTLTFSYIAQTEGIHTDVSGKKIEYKPDIMLKAAPTFIGTKLNYDPKHMMKRNGMENIRPEVADVMDSELIRINEDTIKKYNLDPSLLGRYGLKNRATGKDPIFNSQIREGKLPYHSSEFQFAGDIDSTGVYHPSIIEYTGGILLENEGADPGAVLMDIYNSKYGGNTMPEGNESGGGNESLPTKEEVDKIKLEVENAKKEAESVKKELETFKVENSKLQDKIKSIEAANTSGKTTDEKVVELQKELKAANTKAEELSKKFEAANTTLKDMKDVKRKEILSGIVSNSEYIDKLIALNLDDVAFNAKVDEIKELKEEAKKEFIVSNDVGISTPYDAKNASKEFEAEFGMSKEDMLTKELGISKELIGG